MQINNILNCHKPKSFKGLRETGKVRYKHYEEMSDKALSTYSMAKAFCEVKNSKKSKLLKAMPIITGTLIATSLAVTQPGKLSSKVNSGVGFLVLLSGVNFLSDKFSKLSYKAMKKDNDDTKETITKKLSSNLIGSIGAIGAVIGGAIAIAKNKNAISNSSSKAVQFIKSEGQKLTSELNNSKLGKKIEEKFTPFMERHAKGFNKLKHILPFGIIIGGTVAENSLRDSISADFSKKSLQNYIKGKAAQQDARAHFDSIDAIEV